MVSKHCILVKTIKIEAHLIVLKQKKIFVKLHIVLWDLLLGHYPKDIIIVALSFTHHHVQLLEITATVLCGKLMWSDRYYILIIKQMTSIIIFINASRHN